MEIKRVIAIVLDGVGAGEAPDADEYGDVGSNSLANTARAVGGLQMPNLESLGLGYITDIEGVSGVEELRGFYGKMQPKSAGKDTVSGHWELMGIRLQKPLPTYPNGFPPEIIEEFKARTGKDILGNKAASGTEIIKELGLEHIKTGAPIIYTSADSVFQIAAHEDIIPVPQLYDLCETAREILQGDHAVGRVIARPFTGDSPDNFTRTKNRRDYPLLSSEMNMLDKLVNSNKAVYSVGKIDDIFGHRGITKSNHTSSNRDSILATLDFMKEDFVGLLFVNLIEFDMIYGHRNDPRGYANALEEFDSFVPAIMERMKNTDLLMIVADHGVDPTTPSTDHSREYIPLIVFGSQLSKPRSLGIRETYSDVAATLADIFSLEYPKFGVSFLNDLN
jgi:phosphopentomutase